MSHHDASLLSGLAPLDPRQAELIELVARFAPADGLHDTAIAPLQLVRASAPAQRLPSVYEPGLCDCGRRLQPYVPPDIWPRIRRMVWFGIGLLVVLMATGVLLNR